MNYLGWIFAVIFGVLYMGTSNINDSKILAYERTLRTIETTVEMKEDVMQDLSNHYEKCLNREHKLQKFFRRKVKNYNQIVKLNRQRIRKWQRREKPLIQAHFSQAYRSMAGLEKLMIPYKLAFLTSWAATTGTPLVLK